jgi:hypothetical protein
MLQEKRNSKFFELLGHLGSQTSLDYKKFAPLLREKRVLL